MALYKGKYRIESNRLLNWNYAANGIYFLTFNAHNRECLFGKVENRKMILNEYGQIVENEIKKSAEIRKNWIFHNWIVMPNHVHILVEITNAEIYKYSISERRITEYKEGMELENCFPFGIDHYLDNKSENTNIEIDKTHCSASQTANTIVSTEKTHGSAPQTTENTNIEIDKAHCSAPQTTETAIVSTEKTHCSASQTIETAIVSTEKAHGSAPQTTENTNIKNDKTNCSAPQTTENTNIEIDKTHGSASQTTETAIVSTEKTHCSASQTIKTAIVSTEKAHGSASQTTDKTNIKNDKTNCSAPQTANTNIEIDKTSGGISIQNTSVQFDIPEKELQSSNGIAKRQPKSISSFIALLKSKVTKNINDQRQKTNYKVWQANYHDHIIRDYNEFLKIYWYINHNPAKWKEDVYKS